MDSSTAPFISFVLVIQFTIGALVVVCLLLWLLGLLGMAAWEQFSKWRFGLKFHKEFCFYVFCRAKGYEPEAAYAIVTTNKEREEGKAEPTNEAN